MPIWNTAAVAHGDQFAFWREVICEAFAALDPRPAGDGPGFQGRVNLAGVGAIRYATVHAPPHRVIRGPTEIRRDPQEAVFVNLQLAGTCATRQGDRDHLLRPGDCALLDLTRPYEIDVRDDFAILCVRLPRARLAVRTLPGRIDGARPETRVTTALMRAIWSDATILGPHAASLEGAVCDLLDAALGHLRPPAATMGRIRVHVRARLSEPGLDPTSVARALGMSVRTLHAAFEGTGNTFAAYVRAERLARCAADLRAGRNGGVAEIGWRWGFSDPAHFSRVFTATYGVSPRAYRAEHTTAH